MELKHEEMKNRILNYLDYMNDDDLINVIDVIALVNIIVGEY